MKLKIQFAFILLLAFLVTPLSGCAETPESSDPLLLEFRGARWSDTPEEVRAALGISEDQIFADEAVDEDVPGWSLVVTDLDCLGSVAAYTMFHFVQNQGDHYGLNTVKLYFPEDTDMAAVQGELTKLYGPGSGEYPASYDLRDGVVSESNSADLVKEGGMYWTAGKNGLRDMPQSFVDNAVEFFAQNEADPAGEAAVKEWLEKEPLARISWRDDATVRDEYGTSNRVIFNGGTYVWLLQYFGETTP